MKILVTGNQGYIGTTLTRLLLEKGYEVLGFDADYYNGCGFVEEDKFSSPASLSLRENSLSEFSPAIKQIKKDIRNISKDDLEGVEALIHLAALSNDPLSVFVPQLTNEINFRATVRMANLSKEMGIKRFLYASSCSMYGIAGKEAMMENSPLAPITAYAISKTDSERELTKMADDNFSPVFLRPGTAYGVSPMLRCDLVVNNLTGWAFTTGKIKIMSDGTPWRPIIHVEDFCRGFIACLEAPIELVHNQAFNLSQSSENYQIKDIADAIKEIIPGSVVEYTGEHGADSRTYRVNFDKISTVLKDFFKPTWNLKEGVKQLYEAFKSHNLTLEEFTGNKYVRINQLKKLISEKKLDDNLYWTN
ncbi:MAG: NAD(P)-dependent oxidoreductase [bacterium]|nr:NAD(P)-dependent oxidoreductase [bacterium]